MKIKLKVTVVGFETIETQDYAEEFCEANGLDDDGEDVDEDALTAFAVAQYLQVLEDDGDFVPDDTPSISVEKVEG